MAKVLVIDDSASTLDLMENILTRVGHKVIVMDSGKRAQPFLANESFDLVITDVYMPDMDGLEVLRTVRRIRPGLPVIAMSSLVGKYDMLAVAAALGAAKTLRKPFSVSQLLESVDACLPSSETADARAHDA